MRRRPKQKSYALRGALVVLACVFGLGMLALAVSLYTSGVDARAHAERVAGLPDARSAHAGDIVAVSGTIAVGTPLLRDAFVAFRREQRQGGYCTGTETVTIEEGKQPFAVDTAAGRILIVNADYRFDERLAEWAPIERLDTPPGLTEGGINIVGFVRGSPVLAVGTVESPGDPVPVRAETIAAGPRDLYLARLRGGAAVGSRLIPYLAVIAPLLLLFAFWEGRRIMREL